jgi:hypothetical protein
MTEIKISDEDVKIAALALWNQLREDFPGIGGAMTRQCYEDGRAVIEALVASGWRREEDVLREAAVVLRHHSTFFDDENEYGRGMWAASEVLEAHVDHPVSLRQRATEAEQYVSAGTREGEDQKRDEEQQGA